jgi:exonuclease SbcC
MNNPKIYSLSTVGIVKHYNQDYLLHDQRTDFTGNNGIGKSILADLIQLIFIHDDSLIEFGTNSMDKDGRSAYTLPKDTSEGYAFMNIEVSENAFITIGVCIPNKRSKRLKPFLILKDLDLDKNIEELTFPSSQLPFHSKFINQGQFLGLTDLTRHFRDEHALCLQYFTTNDDKIRYYSFLYKKDILSINLSIRSNLKSFAKIIQSFSRAKSLNLKSSKSLKDFIFEDTEKDYQELFISHKKELERQIQEYKSLEKEIEELENKQSSLTYLKSLEDEKRIAHLISIKSEIYQLKRNRNSSTTKYNASRSSLEGFKKEFNDLRARKPRLSLILSSKESTVSLLNDQVNALRKHEEYNKEIEKLQKEKNSLEDCDAPTVGTFEKNDINTDDFQTLDLIKRINGFKDIFIQYGSVSDMLVKVEQQKSAISKHRIKLEKELAANEIIISLIKLREDGSILSQVIEKKQSLSSGQEATVFNMISTHWGKPSNPSDGTMYTESLSAFSEENIFPDQASGGYWLRMGQINRFIPPLQQAQLFNDPDKLDQALKDMESTITVAKSTLQAELKALDDFERGGSFQAAKINLDYQLDQRLKDFTAYENYEKTAYLISKLDERFDKIGQEIQSCKDKQNELGLTSRIDLSKSVEFYEKDLTAKNKNLIKISSQIATEDTRIKTLKDELIPSMDSKCSVDEIEAIKFTEKYNQKLTDFKKLYPEEDPKNYDHALMRTISAEELFQKYQAIRERYNQEYILIISKFDDTSNEKNIEVNDQVNQLKYNFHILEQALLGSKIKHIDNITEILRELNGSRLSIVEAIFETMLEIFSQTSKKFSQYRSVIYGLNDFFKGKVISNKYYFQIQFEARKDFTIDWIYKLQDQSASAYKSGEIPFSDISVESFVEDFFKKATGFKRGIKFSDLLDPRTYFELNTKLENEAGDKETPGSTGETYSALVLLGIGRLSKVQSDSKKGIKFIILEETANLDATNFGTFPDLAKEHGYQIITMTPKPYGSDSEDGWIMHHLIPGKIDTDINFPIPSSYVKTNRTSTPLLEYIKSQKK